MICPIRSLVVPLDAVTVTVAVPEVGALLMVSQFTSELIE